MSFSAAPGAAFDFEGLLRGAYARQDDALAGTSVSGGGDALGPDDIVDNAIDFPTDHTSQPLDPASLPPAVDLAPPRTNASAPGPPGALDVAAAEGQHDGTTAPTHGPETSARRLYRKKKEKGRKSAKNALLRTSSSQGPLLCNPTAVARNLKDLLTHQTGFKTSSMPHTAPGYQGRNAKGAVKKVYSLEELVGEGSKFGFDLKRWDGMCVAPAFRRLNRADLAYARSPIPLLDDVARIIGVCSGRPKAADWGDVNRSASSAIAAARALCNFPDGCTDHRRGDFPAMAIGVSYGGGQQVGRPLNPRIATLT